MALDVPSLDVVDVEALRALKHSVIGDPARKREVLEDAETVARLIDLLSPPPTPTPLTLNALTQSSIILGSLSYNAGPHLRHLLPALPRALLSALPASRVDARALEAVLRALKELCVAMVDVVGPRVWGTGFEPVRPGEAATDALRDLAEQGLDEVFSLDHLPLVLEPLLVPSASESTPTARTLVLTLLALSVRARRHQAAVLAVPNALESVFHALGSAQSKAREAALETLAALVKDDRQASSRLLRPHAPGRVPVFNTVRDLLSDRSALIRLGACILLANIIKSQPLRPLSASPPKAVLPAPLTHETALALVGALVRLFDEVGELRTRAVFALATLVADAVDLVQAACKLGVVDKLRALLEDSTREEEDEYSVSGSLNSEESVRLREGVLLLLSSLAMHDDPVRSTLIESHLLPPILASLRHSAIGVRASAAQCVRALSRSVGILRTSLVDSGVGKTMVEVAGDEAEDARVRVVALMALCNLVNAFSPLQEALLRDGSVQVLVDLTRSENVGLRVNALFALKNMLYKAPSDLKRSVLSILGWEHLYSLLSSPLPEIAEQSLWLLKNVAARVADVDHLFHSLGHSRLLELLEHRLAVPEPALVLQAVGVLNNIATGSTAHKRAILERQGLGTGVRGLLNHSDESIRSAAAWTLKNLIEPPPEGHHRRAHAETLAKVRQFGYERPLHQLRDDPSYNVREPVRLALHGLEGSSVGGGLHPHAYSPAARGSGR